MSIAVPSGHLPLVFIGECMAEIAPADADTHRLGFAGDTFNAAWASRLLMDARPVRYVTTIGTDWISDEMFAFMQKSGLDVSAVRRDPARSIGLYAIRLTDGERSFAYWRRDSAATTLADDPDHLAMSVADAATVFFSGITLAILSGAGRRTLFSVLRQARADGARIAFDPNYRARLWRDAEEARDLSSEAATVSDIVLPSFSDEAELFGDTSPGATADRFAALGASEIVVKDGSGPALCVFEGSRRWVNAEPVTTVIDSTGAGDAFNGAYLAARVRGAKPFDATRLGHRTASVAIRTRGALIPRDIATELAAREGHAA